MNTLEDFRSNANKHGICELSKAWDNAKSKKQLMDLALSAKAIPYLAKAISEGWGISSDVIYSEYNRFINGRFILDTGDYSSAMYCRDKNINITTTTAILIECSGKVNVDRICELHIVNSNVELTGSAVPYVYFYNSTVTNADKAEYIVRT